MPSRFIVAIAAIFSFVHFSATAHAADALTNYYNNSAINNCLIFEANEFKPNPKNSACKVVLNSPGEKETRIHIDSTVNVGSLLHPKEEVRRIEYRFEKTNGKISKSETTITSPSSKKPDVFTMEIGPDGAPTKARMSQFGQTYEFANRDMCMPLKPLIEEFGRANIANCSAVFQKMAGPLKTLQTELAKDKIQLGFVQPSTRMPSLSKAVALNPERMSDAATFMGSCTQLFAAEDKMLQDASAAVAPVAKPAPANQ